MNLIKQAPQFDLVFYFSSCNHKAYHRINGNLTLAYLKSGAKNLIRKSIEKVGLSVQKWDGPEKGYNFEAND